MDYLRHAPLRSVALVVALAACSGDDATTDASATDVSVTATGTTAATMTTGASATTGNTTGATTQGGTESDSATTTTGESTGPITATDATTTTTDATTVATDTDATSGTTGEPTCAQGEVICEGDTAKVCDGMGGFESEEPCAEACAPGLGCVLCVPGSGQCNGDQVEICNGQGDGYDPGESCDPIQGLACDPDLGACAGACAALGLSYVGCDYYALVTQQYDLYNTAPQYNFAIAVANTSAQIAKVTVTRGANTVTTADVPASSVKVINLPWIDALTKGTGPSILLADGAYRVRSDRPVTVYQFNPVGATATNDASLLLPVNTWRDRYMAVTWPNWDGINLPAFYAVVASVDDTTVTLAPSATGKKIQAGGGVAADGTGVIKLGEGDVLQVLTSPGGDVTGTIVSADKPIEVFSGHDCTNVPFNIGACDHLEEAMFPIDTLAKEYLVVPPVQVPNSTLDKAQIIRVVASEAGTTLTFDPDQPVGKSLANVGDFVEIPMTTAAFKVTADKKISVVQFMVGQSAGFGTSDPAMLQAVPAEQYRSDYLFYAEKNWVANFVDIIGPDGATATVDGAPVGMWKPITGTGYSVAHVQLSNAGDGTHSVSASAKVGISVYGVQDYGSYWYPGGLDLDVIPQ